MVIAIVGSTGEVTLTDAFSDSEMQAVDDESQDVIMVLGPENTEGTSITFHMAVVTSDTTGDVDVRGAEMTIQWAFASADKFSSKHRSAGVADVNFFTGTSTAKTYPKNNIYLIVLFFPIVLIFIAIVANAMIRVCRERKMKRKFELEKMPV
jgi:hypothetical protein